MTSSLGREFERVDPLIWSPVVADRGCDKYSSVVKRTGRKVSDSRDSPANLERLLQTAAVDSKITKKPDRVKKVRLSSCVGSDDKKTFADDKIRLLKVPPVLEAEARYPHALRLTWVLADKLRVQFGTWGPGGALIDSPGESVLMPQQSTNRAIGRRGAGNRG
jgi:hypothetical protein